MLVKASCSGTKDKNTEWVLNREMMKNSCFFFFFVYIQAASPLGSIFKIQ